MARADANRYCPQLAIPRYLPIRRVYHFKFSRAEVTQPNVIALPLAFHTGRLPHAQMLTFSIPAYVFAANWLGWYERATYALDFSSTFIRDAELGVSDDSARRRLCRQPTDYEAVLISSCIRIVR